TDRRERRGAAGSGGVVFPAARRQNRLSARILAGTLCCTGLAGAVGGDDVMQSGLAEFIQAMPKVELHVHLQGATQPGTLLMLAKRNKVTLPYDTIEGIREWYNFRDFRQFIDIYVEICRCLQNADDLELMAREFLKNQAAQYIVYSEVTYTPALRDHYNGFTFDQQLAAIIRANDWARAELGTSM